MTKLIKILKSKAGTAMPLAVAIAMALLLIFCGIMEYARLLFIAQGVRDAVQSAVIATVNDNYDDAYHGVREGYSGAYQPIASDFEQSLDYGDIYARLDDILGLNRNGSYHVKLTTEGKTEFKVWGLKVDIKNAPFAPSGFENPQFIADSTIELEVPISYAGSLLPPMKITVKTSAGYTPKF